MKTTLGFLVAAAILFAPSSAAAQVSGLEFLNISADAKIGDVIAAIYVYGVGFVALAALIVFTAGGVRYIFTGDKDPSEAKSWMKNAFWGLVLALTSWLILYTINPELVKNIGNLNLQTTQTTKTDNPGGIDQGDETTCAPACRQGYKCVQQTCTLSSCFAIREPSGAMPSEQTCRAAGCGFVGGGNPCVPR